MKVNYLPIHFVQKPLFLYGLYSKSLHRTYKHKIL